MERPLLANPAIATAAVVGMPNERWVEAVATYVVATPGMALNEAEVIGAAKAELGGRGTQESGDCRPAAPDVHRQN